MPSVQTTFSALLMMIGFLFLSALLADDPDAIYVEKDVGLKFIR